VVRLLGVRGLGMGLAFGVHIAIGRLAGPENYGIYITGLGLIGLLVTICKLGVDTAILRHGSALHARRDLAGMHGVIRAALSTSVAGAGAVAIAGTGFLLVGGAGIVESGPVRLTLILALLVVPFSILLQMCQAGGRMLGRVLLPEALDGLVQPLLLISLIGAVVVVGRGADIKAAGAPLIMGLNLIAVVLAATTALILLLRWLPRGVFSEVPRPSRRMVLATALPLFIGGCGQAAMDQLDVVILSAVIGPEAVGIYGVAVRIAMLAQVALASINVIAAPMLARVGALDTAEEREGLMTLVGRVSMISLGVAGPVLLGLLLLGPLVIRVFGPEYGDAAPLFDILLLGYAGYALGLPAMIYLSMRGHQRTVAVSYVAVALVTVAVYAVVVPVYGAEGAAWTRAAGGLAVNLLMIIAAARRLGMLPLYPFCRAC